MENLAITNAIPVLQKEGIISNKALDVNIGYVGGGSAIPQKKFDELVLNAKAPITSGVYIEWIDNRFHIHGIRGISKGNKIILGSFQAISELIANLEYAKNTFSQNEMISTKNHK